MGNSISIGAFGLTAITALTALGLVALTGAVNERVLASGGESANDTEAAHVTVDTEQVLRPIPPNLFSTGKYTTDPVLQKWAQEAGFALVRVDVLLDAVEPVNDDDDSQHFNWAGFQWGDNAAQYGANLDEVVQQMVAHGHKPLLILHRTQPWNGDGTWQSVPRDPEEWAEAAAATVYHFNKELGYGIQYWEIWNEPDVRGEFRGSLGQYLEMARVAARRMKEIDPTIKVGGPVWSHADLSVMRQVIQQAWDVFDFYSWHAYGTGGEESERLSDADILAEVESKYGRFARSLRQMVERYDQSGRPKEIAITEFNIDWAETQRG
ncbi:MAG: GH39 family glycosyl hydrolase, partial [Bacteroidota bacterium]